MENNNKDDNRILGRVLAVEETKAVSGAIEKTAATDDVRSRYILLQRQPTAVM